jgi:3-deoxy-D-manno-octulosonate 8-phosphate phosphatase (KDO 8-P phosphatase)
MSHERAKKIKVLLFDVDGVLTDGTIWLFPFPSGPEINPQKQALRQDDAGAPSVVSSRMVESKGFHAHDGVGMSLARLGGLKLGIVTKRMSEAVALRARDLKLDHVFQGQHNKLEALEKVIAAERVRDENIAFVGDDIVDLNVMRRCGLAVAVPNARPEVKDAAHFVTEHPGGEGAARDAIEYILRAQGTWDDVLAQYLGGQLEPKRRD